MYKWSRQELWNNNISYNNKNIIITISRYIENPGIVRTVCSVAHFQAYLGTFSNIQPCSGILLNI